MRRARGGSMTLRSLQFATLLLAALSLTMESAHVLELPQKLQYGAQMYSAVNTTLYRYFAYVGAVYQIGAMVAALGLAYGMRGHDSASRWATAGAVCLVLAFVAWLAIVAPVNGQIADALRNAPDSVPRLWMELRARWEGGHALGFVVQLLGLSALIWSVLPEPRPLGA
jgi:hypothetical protein